MPSERSTTIVRKPDQAGQRPQAGELGIPPHLQRFLIRQPILERVGASADEINLTHVKAMIWAGELET